MNGEWMKIDIGLGRHRDTFQIVLGASHASENYNAGIAIDEISFFDCGPKPPQESCAPDEFHCEVNLACVTQSQTCDLSDDCGDGTDEMLAECYDYNQESFENPLSPFGYFQQDDEDADFKWSRGNGTTINTQTGPPFDHTYFDSNGRYLFIASEKQEPGEKAYLVTPMVKAPGVDGSCHIRFFVHLHGHGLGNLTIYSM